jgi:O-antigen/teichoic acid export membrane protein
MTSSSEKKILGANNSKIPADPRPPGSFFNRAMRNFIFSGFGSVANIVVGLLFVGVTIRYLGNARSGFLMSLAALTGLGLDIPVVKRVAFLNTQGDYPTARQIIGSVSVISFFAGLSIAIPIVLFYPTIFRWTRLDESYLNEALWATIFTMITFIISQVTNPWRSTYNAVERFDLVSGLDTTFGILNGLCGLAVLAFFPSMAVLAAARLVVVILRSGVDSLLTSRLLHGIIWPAWNWSEIKLILRFGGWVYIEAVGEILFARINSLIITAFLGSEVLPYYEVPQRFYIQAHRMLLSLSNFLFPMLASFGDNAKEQIHRVEDRLRWLIALASAAMYACIAIIGPAIITQLVTPEFSRIATLPLYLVCISGFFHAQNLLPYLSSHALGIGKPNAILGLVKGGSAALGALFLIPRLGFIGASFAQLTIGLVIVVHIIWVQKIISPGRPIFDWTRSFFSPLMLIITWLIISNALLSPQSNLGSILAINAMGLAVGFLILIVVEKSIFRDQQRIRILLEIINVPLNRVLSLLKFSQSKMSS